MARNKKQKRVIAQRISQKRAKKEAELFPNMAQLYQRLRVLQQKEDALRRKLNPDKYNDNGVAKSREEAPGEWKSSKELERLQKRIRKQHRKIACERKQVHNKLANLIFALGGDFRIERMMWKAFAKRMRKSPQESDTNTIAHKAAAGTSSTAVSKEGESHDLNKDLALASKVANANKSKSGQQDSGTVTTANNAVAKSKEQLSSQSDSKNSQHHYPEQFKTQKASESNAESTTSTGNAHNKNLQKVSCATAEARISANCCFYGHGKNLVNQRNLAPSQHYLDSQGQLHKQKLKLSERYHCGSDGKSVQRDIMAANLLQHTTRSADAQEAHQKHHKSYIEQPKGMYLNAMMDQYDLETLQQDSGVLHARNQVACEYIKKHGSSQLLKSFAPPKNQDEQQKPQPKHLFPKQALSHMQVQELNLTDLKKPVLSGNIELGFGYTRISTICSYSVEY